jgi:hypothetical protein
LTKALVDDALGGSRASRRKRPGAFDCGGSPQKVLGHLRRSFSRGFVEKIHRNLLTISTATLRMRSVEKFHREALR